MTDTPEQDERTTENGPGEGLDAEDQAGKGYGADEGEREEALPDE